MLTLFLDDVSTRWIPRHVMSLGSNKRRSYSIGYAGRATAYPANPANTGNPYIYLPLTSICAQLFSHLSAARPLSATTSGSIWTRTHRLAQVAKLNARTSVDLNASIDGKGCIGAGAAMIGDHHRMNYICYINF